ncbi:MAG: polysaccharide biosynthesis C-terminal domain-containing protein, partial [Haloarculaceae archaeon]
VFGTISIALTLLLFAPGVRGAVAGYVGVDVPGLLALAIGSWLFADLHIRTVQGENRVLLAGLLQLTQDLVRVGVGAAAITVGMGAIGLMYGVIVGFGATVIVGFLLTDVRPRRPARRDFRSLFAISKYTAVFGPTNFVYFWFDTFMIGLLLTKAAVSSYEVAWQTTRVLIIPTTAIVQTVFPKVSRWASEGDYDEIERILPGAILFTLFIPVPGLVGISVLGPEILGLVYRPSYAEAALPMVILAGYMVVESLHRLGQVVATGLDRAEIPFRSRLVGVSLAVVLNVLLIPQFGLLGAAVGTFLAKLVDASILWIRTAGVVAVDLPVRSLLREIASALAMGLLVAGVATVVGISSLPLLFAVVGIGVAFYALAVLRDEDIHQVLNQYVPIRLPGG